MFIHIHDKTPVTIDELEDIVSKGIGMLRLYKPDTNQNEVNRIFNELIKPIIFDTDNEVDLCLEDILNQALTIKRNIKKQEEKRTSKNSSAVSYNNNVINTNNGLNSTSQVNWTTV